MSLREKYPEGAVFTLALSPETLGVGVGFDGSEYHATIAVHYSENSLTAVNEILELMDSAGTEPKVYLETKDDQQLVKIVFHLALTLARFRELLSHYQPLNPIQPEDEDLPSYIIFISAAEGVNKSETETFWQRFFIEGFFELAIFKDQLTTLRLFRLEKVEAGVPKSDELVEEMKRAKA